MQKIKLVGLACLLLGLLLALAGCASQQAEPTVGVGVTSVNYTDQDYPASLLVDPLTNQAAGGEPADAYSAGGDMCCYSLPTKWHAGIQIKVRLMLPSLGKTYKERAYEADRWIEQLVEVPPYPNGRPGTLWTVIYPGPKLEVLSSVYDPSNANWPGRIKGWPVPSLEYRRKLWDRTVDETKTTLSILESAGKKDPEKAHKYAKSINILKERIKSYGSRP